MKNASAAAGDDVAAALHVFHRERRRGTVKQVAAKRSVRRSAWERPGADRWKKLPGNEPFANSVLPPHVGLSRFARRSLLGSPFHGRRRTAPSRPSLPTPFGTNCLCGPGTPFPTKNVQRR